MSTLIGLTARDFQGLSCGRDLKVGITQTLVQQPDLGKIVSCRSRPLFSLQILQPSLHSEIKDLIYFLGGRGNHTLDAYLRYPQKKKDLLIHHKLTNSSKRHRLAINSEAYV